MSCLETPATVLLAQLNMTGKYTVAAWAHSARHKTSRDQVPTANFMMDEPEKSQVGIWLKCCVARLPKLMGSSISYIQAHEAHSKVVQESAWI